jgi:hypothetical protein
MYLSRTRCIGLGKFMSRIRKTLLSFDPPLATIWPMRNQQETSSINARGRRGRHDQPRTSTLMSSPSLLQSALDFGYFQHYFLELQLLILFTV